MKSTKIFARAGVIAALYIVLSLITFPVASGVIQFRLSEALTVLPLIFPEAVPALFVGCMLSNLITGCTVIDIFLGGLVTLVAAALTYYCGKIFKKTFIKLFVGGIFPVILNALFLPLIWLLCGIPIYFYPLQVLFLFISQAVSVYAFGTPLYIGVEKAKKRYKNL